jgi:splicing factor 1
MAVKLEQSSPARQPKPAMSPSLPSKLSLFGAKARFVIPKKQIRGSMVIRKVEAPATPKEKKTLILSKGKQSGVLISPPKAKALAY